MLKQICVLFTFLTPFIVANKNPIQYSPYQLKVWSIVATEGYVSKWKPDGVRYHKGKKIQMYAIGCGYNDYGTSERRKAIASYLKDGLTFSEAVEISLAELEKRYSGNHTDPYTKLAFQLHAYKTGRSVKSNFDLLGCCGGKGHCGSDKGNVVKSHTEARKFEYALASHDFDTINEMGAKFKTRKEMIERRYNPKNNPKNQNYAQTNQPKTSGPPGYKNDNRDNSNVLYYFFGIR